MITVRAAHERDIPQIKKIADANKRYLGFTVRAILGSSIAKGELYVALIGNKIIGFIRWHRRKDGWTTVYELAVDEGHRKQGVGKKLMEIVGQGPAKLKCHTTNPAICFYTKLGFGVQSTEITKGGKSLDFLTRGGKFQLLGKSGKQ